MRLTFDILQQYRDVRGDVVMARPLPECRGPLAVVLQRKVGNFLQILRIQCHVGDTELTIVTCDACFQNIGGANWLPLTLCLRDWNIRLDFEDQPLVR